MVTKQDMDVLVGTSPPRKIERPMRHVALRGQGQFFIGLIVGTVVCTVIFLVFFPWSITKAIRLSLAGTSAQGAVIESFYGNRTIGDNVILRKRPVFWVRFKFVDAEGHERLAASMYSKHLAAGTPVQLEYLPADPKVAKLVGGFFVPGGLFEVFWASIFLVFPAIGYWNFLRWRRNRLGLFSHGVCVQGQLERVWREDPKDETRGWIEISYVTDEGAFRQSQVVEDQIFKRAHALIQETTNIRVLYSPNAPREHLVVELIN